MDRVRRPYSFFLGLVMALHVVRPGLAGWQTLHRLMCFPACMYCSRSRSEAQQFIHLQRGSLCKRARALAAAVVAHLKSRGELLTYCQL